ncbi:MAG TPA: type VII secretion protein EssC, partial [Lachnospiraceae bacterium]|nr:type VII secretion protein EssC [Lachnospiraceae bacterium]
MSIVISVYSPKAFKEYILPSINNADYQIRLERQYFQLEEDITLNLEVLDEVWKILPDRRLRLTKDRLDYAGHMLRNNDVLMLEDSHKEKLSLIIKDVSTVFHAYSKFSIEAADRIAIGKGADNDIVYDYLKLVSREHAVIEKKGPDHWIINKSSNGTYINAVKIETETKLSFGDYINILGLHILYLGNILAIDDTEKNAVIGQKLTPCSGVEEGTVLLDTEAREGKTLYHRSPRSYEKPDETPIEIENPPEKDRQKRQPMLMLIGPSITMALPMMLGCMLMVYSASSSGGGSSLYMYSGLIMAVASAALGVLWALLGVRYEKKEEAAASELRFSAYSDYLVKKTDDVKERYESTAKLLESMYPSTEACLAYDGTAGELWNRNRSHEDFLRHRLGTGDIPFQAPIVVEKKKFKLYQDELAEKPALIKENYEKLFQAPVTVDLAEHGLIGLAGKGAREDAVHIARILSAQIAANNCYTDVKLGYIYDGSTSAEREAWSFAKWLPHVWSEDRKYRFLASNREEAGDVFYELARIFRERTEAAKEAGAEKTVPMPYYVIFISDPSMLEGELFSKYVSENDGRFGLTTVLLAASRMDLPNSCEYIIENEGGLKGICNAADGQDRRTALAFDVLNGKKLTDFSRRLSSFRVTEMESGGEIPSGLTFFDMFGIHRPQELPVKELWAKNRIYENIRGVIGQKAGGAPCYLDVHEKYHGPHGLVAGTTGSGKSETLQTYMLSLAVNYSPDDIGFFIIDYKGGGMAHLFDGLPHMIGQISNLSGNQVKRAMVSIKSENRRRQRVFNENGVNNINAYTRLYKNGEAARPVPHLFIIIDEFAELKREEPDFMKELISVAQVGRSLGVHLILATQKPNGTVDDNIWSNSKFRLCLRVQDKQDSNDMLHKPDAAYITQAGRCYLQVGNDEIYELFQSGYSGAAYHEDAADEGTDAAKLLSLNGRVELTGNMIRAARKQKARKASQKHAKEVSQLEAVKDYLAQVAAECHYDCGHQLWMPVLPKELGLDSFDEFTADSFTHNGFWQDRKEWSLNIVAGKMDDPANQNQMPLVVDFAADGHIAICGGIVSGKSTLMQTMAYALIQKYTPEEIHIYGLDFSGRLLSAFEDAPQVGGIMYESDTDKISKFFHMLERILEERKSLFRGGNYSQYVRANGVIVPAILLFVDNYAAFREKTDEDYEDIMIRLAKEGVNHGIFLIVSGMGYGMNDISSRVGENIGRALCLALQDRYEYGELLHSFQIDVTPESGIRGRGLAACAEGILEYQAALAVAAENDYQRMDRIRAECAAMAAAWTKKCARKVPEIPAKPVWSLF